MVSFLFPLAEPLLFLFASLASFPFEFEFELSLFELAKVT
jgi:hypothetical protein